MSSRQDTLRRPRPRLPLTVLAGAVALSVAAVSGCSATPKPGVQATKPAVASRSPGPAAALQLRLAMTTVTGMCRLPALTASGPGSACSLNGTSSYQLGPSTGDVTVAHAVVGTEIGGVSLGNPVAIVQLDKPGTATFALVTATVTGKPLAIVLHGRVVNAPIIRESIRDGKFPLTTQPPDAKPATQLVATLNAGQVKPRPGPRRPHTPLIDATHPATLRTTEEWVPVQLTDPT
jgi:hypothetical protein